MSYTTKNIVKDPKYVNSSFIYSPPEGFPVFNCDPNSKFISQTPSHSPTPSQTPSYSSTLSPSKTPSHMHNKPYIKTYNIITDQSGWKEVIVEYYFVKPVIVCTPIYESINENWIVKMEGHLMDGLKDIVEAEIDMNDPEDKWMLYAMKLSYSF